MPRAVVEAKAAYKSADNGVKPAKAYAEMLGLTFAYSTNGKDIIEVDYSTGLEQLVDTYPTPFELRQRQTCNWLLTGIPGNASASDRFGEDNQRMTGVPIGADGAPHPKRLFICDVNRLRRFRQRPRFGADSHFARAYSRQAQIFNVSRIISFVYTLTNQTADAS